MGYQQNTAHAANPRRSSSTHASSNLIHSGLCLPPLAAAFASSLNLDGFTFSQNVPSCMFRHVRHGFTDHRPPCARKKVLNAGTSTDPPDGAR